LVQAVVASKIWERCRWASTLGRQARQSEQTTVTQGSFECPSQSQYWQNFPEYLRQNFQGDW